MHEKLKLRGLVATLALWGCSEEPAPNDNAGGNCWYCTGGGGAGGNGGASTGGGGSGGKTVTGDTTYTIQGELDTATGIGTYRTSTVQTAHGKSICDIGYTVTGATADATCAKCTLAYAMPLSDPVVNAGTLGCDKMMTGTVVTWGHADPGTLYISKAGTWYPVDKGANSKVDGTTWTFDLTSVIAAK
jgi:hypothetical protein